VRWNAQEVGDRYADLLRVAGKADAGAPGERLAARLEELAYAGGLAGSLDTLGVPREDLPALAADAATQWTGANNPRPFDAGAALELYERAYEARAANERSPSIDFLTPAIQ